MTTSVVDGPAPDATVGFDAQEDCHAAPVSRSKLGKEPAFVRSCLRAGGQALVFFVLFAAVVVVISAPSARPHFGHAVHIQPQHSPAFTRRQVDAAFAAATHNQVEQLVPTTLEIVSLSQLPTPTAQSTAPETTTAEPSTFAVPSKPAIERLKAYLQRSRKALYDMFHPLKATTLSARQKLHVVMGNQASDLDSMATSIIHAFTSAAHHHADNSSLPIIQNNTLIVPMMNIPRQDYRLRTEVAYMFAKIGLTPEMLVFVDDFDANVINARGLLQVTLVDHNMLAPEQASFGSSVVRILDHHSDDGHHAGIADRQVDLVGSCSTLMTERILASPELKATVLDAHVAALLLGTILVDTVNLDTVKGKTTQRDLDAAHALIGSASSFVARGQLFADLRREKFNHAALTSDELLRRDYKEDRSTNTAIGISSISMSVRELMQRDRSYARAIVRFATLRNLKVLAVMNSFFAPDFSRQLTIYTADKKSLKRVVSHLFRNGIVDFELTKVNVPGLSGEARIVTFTQSNLRASRKVLMPLLKGCFSGDLSTLQQQAAQSRTVPPTPAPTSQSSSRTKK
ncbi:hypothetical protein CAOG_04060 [Capsaspora owczarzaki ATCC 30864]|uniref:DHHA2 domain-containing protein n=1 Tax=Capsaspora owczarzaki (strain ATCC 30864) TaxID=595528 RepID=A0A0D2UDU3_CAPO3|nr:hypothetical protein CAOG_04060 [Capsaspora owczarzaki ATCC 30864]KJE93246.1 hypothetical protein CAOG_004060 [Capsaspora owczarzaki ATCC 30864]|eukprot:XP_004347885.1 hypothetical protein CAOG_04060 [Capsaspora owczarzaki ATCC 30864]